MSSPASAIFMGVYEPIKQHVEKRVPDNRQFLASLSGGLGAGLAASVVRVPTEVVKQRMQNGAALSLDPWPLMWSASEIDPMKLQVGTKRDRP